MIMIIIMVVVVVMVIMMMMIVLFFTAFNKWVGHTAVFLNLCETAAW